MRKNYENGNLKKEKTEREEGANQQCYQPEFLFFQKNTI